MHLGMRPYDACAQQRSGYVLSYQKNKICTKSLLNMQIPVVSLLKIIYYMTNWNF